MNFLAHLYLSGTDPELLVGNFMGDFVKGRVGNEFPPRVTEGIVLHRRIDSYAQQHPLFLKSRLRLAPGYGLYRGVMVDLFYDHFLSVEWEEWEVVPLDNWLVRTRAIVTAHSPHLPQRLRELTPVIFEELIPSYREVEGIGRALQRMSRRVRRPNPLAGGEEELAANYGGLRDDFRGFVPAIREFVSEYLAVRIR